MKKIILLLLIIFSLKNFSQQPNLDSNLIPKNNLNEYKYRFFKGDTIRYRVSSSDSIVIEFGKPLVKDRFELIEVTCDSVLKNGRFVISIRLLKFITDEAIVRGEKVRKTSSPWINRKVSIVIDTAGNRFSPSIENPNIFTMSPGGAFQPHLFIPFKEMYKLDNESWIVKTNDTLAENGNPFPIVNESYLFRAYPPQDTLDYLCNRLSFIKTSTGKVTTITDDVQILVEAVINLGGFYYLSQKHQIPICMIATSEQKLKITTPTKETMPGYHYISTVYLLDTFIPSPERLKYYDRIEKQKEKIIDKKKKR